MFSQAEKERYKRQFSLDNFGQSNQLKLKQARVLVIGAGALGCPVLTYLAAAGVGTIGIVDNDTVELSNLHRQVLYTVDDLGEPKAAIVAKRLQRMNPEISVTFYPVIFTPENAIDLIRDYDVIIDGTDNFPTRYLINDACVLLGKTNVHGSVVRYSGTVSVFNYCAADGSFGPNYRDLFPVPPRPEEAPSCAEAGVIGVLPSIIGSLQAMEAIKVITGIGEPASGKFIRYDALTNRQEILRFQKDPGNPLNNADETFIFETNYPAFCHQHPTDMKSITVTELKELIDNGSDFQLIDVREPYENDICTLNGELIPMGEVPGNVEKIDRSKQVVVHCRSGKRSASIIDFLEQNYGYTNLYNLTGGILAWADEIDPTMESY